MTAHSSDGSAPKRVIGRPFKKGQSGNPGGRPKDVYGIAKLALDKCPESIKTLVEIMEDKTAPHAARIAACNSILDRGLGKALQQTQTQQLGSDGQPITPSTYSDPKPEPPPQAVGHSRGNGH